MDHLVFDSETGEVSINGMLIHNVKSIATDYDARNKGLVSVTISMLCYVHGGTDKSKTEFIDSIRHNICT